MEFKVEYKSANARACRIKTTHSEILTPAFMPVGTLAAIKSLDAIDMSEILDAKIILANTYHLYLRPSSKVIKQMGGLHGFSKFNRIFFNR